MRQAPVISFGDRGRRVLCRTLFNRYLSFVAVLCGIAAAPGTVRAQFKELQTPTLRLIYTSPLQSYLVPQVVGTFDKALQFH